MSMQKKFSLLNVLNKSFNEPKLSKSQITYIALNSIAEISPGIEYFSIDRSFAFDFLQLARLILTCFLGVKVCEIWEYSVFIIICRTLIMDNADKSLYRGCLSGFLCLTKL